MVTTLHHSVVVRRIRLTNSELFLGIEIYVVLRSLIHVMTDKTLPVEYLSLSRTEEPK
jgi:hypothetical protein